MGFAHFHCHFGPSVTSHQEYTQTFSHSSVSSSPLIVLPALPCPYEDPFHHKLPSHSTCGPEQEGRGSQLCSTWFHLSHGLAVVGQLFSSKIPVDAHLSMACPAGVWSTSSPACRRTSMTVLFPRKCPATQDTEYAQPHARLLVSGDSFEPPPGPVSGPTSSISQCP